MQVAIFDFDGTLYEEETFKLLMNHLKEHPTYHTQYKRFYRSIVPPYIANKLKVYPTSSMKKRSMQLYLEAFEGRTRDDMYQYFDELKDQIQNSFNRKVLEKLHAHQQNNIHIYLVSGAYTEFLERVTEGITFQQIIGTEILYKDNFVYTKSPLEHVNGEMKTKKLLERLEGEEIDWENSYAYGDSYSDLPVLELVGNPIAVKPENKLLAVAQERGWEILK